MCLRTPVTSLASSSVSACHAASGAMVAATAASGADSISASVPAMCVDAICVVSHPATSGASSEMRRLAGSWSRSSTISLESSSFSARTSSSTMAACSAQPSLTTLCSITAPFAGVMHSSSAPAKSFSIFPITLAAASSSAMASISAACAVSRRPVALAASSGPMCATVLEACSMGILRRIWPERWTSISCSTAPALAGSSSVMMRATRSGSTRSNTIADDLGLVSASTLAALAVSSPCTTALASCGLLGVMDSRVHAARFTLAMLYTRSASLSPFMFSTMDTTTAGSMCSTTTAASLGAISCSVMAAFTCSTLFSSLAATPTSVAKMISIIAAP
mmetsp:Transcript_33442/g.72993  ORF Transcript_33442/g.72993 Transcript_33442/m.72993 type:complete len:335 (+) Transcript_33442:883-1887(+)